MNAIILIIPFFIIRFGLLSFFGKGAATRVAILAPTRGNEKIAYLIYQVTTLLLLVVPFFLTIRVNQPFISVGIILYIMSLVVLTLSIRDFAQPQQNGLNTQVYIKFLAT